MSSVNEISKETILSLEGDIYIVTEFQHVNPGKGASFTRTRIRNIKTGKIVERTFKSNESVDIVEVERRKMQFLYKNGEMFSFMDNSNYEQTDINAQMLESKTEYLKEGLEVMVIFYQGTPLNVELPRKITYKVADSPPGVKGDTAGGNVTKGAVMDTGLKVQVPLFIKEGENIIVNTETGAYVERA